MKNKKNILLLLSITALAITSITSVFAWYVSNIGIIQDFNDNKLAANASYYESGKGTENDPYVIANARHLYNLAWLQDLGYYDDKVYYFKLKNDIDMSNLKLATQTIASPIPAIGIDAHPFIGVFDGQGYTINNLYVASYFSGSNCITPSREILQERNQDSTYKSFNTSTNMIISSYNGLFGIIKKYSDDTIKEENSASKVTNFTIANAKIESSQNTLVGYICGYVNSNLSTVGVAKSQLTLSSGITHVSSYPVSKYGIIGDYNNSSTGIGWEDSGDVGYGTSTDIRELYYALGGNDDTHSVEVGGKQAFPFRVDSSDSSIQDPSQTSAEVQISASSKADVNLAKNQKAASNNIGYYVGNSVKAFRDSSVTNLTITTPSYLYNYFSTDVPSEVTEYLNKQTTDNSGGVSHNYQYSIFISDSTATALSSGYNNPDNLNLVENAKVNNFSCTSYTASNEKVLLVPNRCIWVAPKQAGKFRLVVYNTENSAVCQLTIYRLVRSTPKDYSTYFTSATKFLIKQGVEITGSDANLTIPKSNSNVALQAYYYTFDVSANDVNAGYEFAITQNVGKPYIAYLDIGNNGSSDPGYIGYINDIDFTYVSGSGYAIVGSEGFDLSKVYFNIDGTTTKEVSLYVMRSINTGNYVYYYFISDGGLNITTSGKPESKSKDDWDKQE